MDITPTRFAILSTHLLETAQIRSAQEMLDMQISPHKSYHVARSKIKEF